MILWGAPGAPHAPHTLAHASGSPEARLGNSSGARGAPGAPQSPHTLAHASGWLGNASGSRALRWRVMVLARLFLGVVIGSLGVSACATPIARRDAQAIRELAEKEGVVLLARVTVYADARLQQYLTSVVGRLRRTSAEGISSVRVTVIEDPTLAAFAMPNGNIYVHTGLLSAVESEAQLAAILARELSRSADVPWPQATRARMAHVTPSPTAAAILDRKSVV